ncbi:hypothetical protein CPB97_010328 [Podila verticillata]|nr:hypothetical protein CPB97_010328 [Podila verticillata]
MDNLHAIDLHEICILITKHLDTPSLFACTLVNRAWNTSFTPCLYHSVHLTYRGPNLTDTTNPSLQHIHHLTFTHGSLWTDPPVALSRLTSLTVMLPRPSTLYPQSWAVLTALLSTTTKTLSQVDLFNDCTPPSWHALAQCEALSTLRLRNINVNTNDVPLVHKVCTMVETLDLEDVVFPEAMSQLPYSAPLMRLRHLRMRGVVWRRSGWHSGWYVSSASDETDADGVMTAPWTCSPLLESLLVVTPTTGWRWPYRLEDVTAAIRAALAADEAGWSFYSCPHTKHEVDEGGHNLCEQYRGLVPARKLHTLETVNGTMRDHDLAFLLDHVEKTMQVLCVPTAKVGSLTVNALARHYTTLTKINVRHANIGSLGVLTILQNGSQLHSLGATGLLGQDVVTSSAKPWACTRLQRLSIDILIDEQVDLSVYATQVQNVFQKLGELTQLEFLDLQSLRKWPLEREFAWLKLKIGYGLEDLAVMTKLREIRAQRKSYDDFDITDAQWMVEHWKKLKVVGVDGLVEAVSSREVRRVFLARRIAIVTIQPSLEIE